MIRLISDELLRNPLVNSMFFKAMGYKFKENIILRNYNGGSVLEVGCCTGDMSKIFTFNGCSDYVGIDINKRYVDYATKKYGLGDAFVFKCMDVNNCTLDRTFDFIFLGSILHHISDGVAVKLLSSCKELLSDKGVILLMDPLTPTNQSSFKTKVWYFLERGKYVRDYEGYKFLMSEFTILQDSTMNYGLLDMRFIVLTMKG